MCSRVCFVEQDIYNESKYSFTRMSDINCIVAFEREYWDPKGGELCLGKTKSEETLMEVCSNTDVQIVCLI